MGAILFEQVINGDGTGASIAELVRIERYRSSTLPVHAQVRSGLIVPASSPHVYLDADKGSGWEELLGEVALGYVTDAQVPNESAWDVRVRWTFAPPTSRERGAPMRSTESGVGRSAPPSRRPSTRPPTT